MRKKLVYSMILGALFLMGASSQAHAATMQLLPNTIFDVRTGGELHINLVIDTEGDYINATEAKISFSNDVLELLSVDRSSSVFSFWLQEPEVSNENGTIQFIGGSPRGLSGEALRVLKLRFLVTGIGKADIRIGNAVVSASDGKGTNVLTGVEGIQIENTGVSESAINIPVTTTGQTEQPHEVTRTPVEAGALPEKPNVRVNLYSNQMMWHNHSGDTIALWDLPDDVIKIATALDQNPNTVPKTSTEELSTGVNFGALDDGIWYIHVQFKNNIGWGEVAHYRIALDTEPPLDFDIDVDNISGDNPTPRVSCATHDALSGVARLELYIDGELVFTDEAISEEVCLVESQVSLEPQAPGTHTIVARMFDFAGNSVEQRKTFEIAPIKTPKISFVPESVSLDGGEFVWGEAVPNALITLRMFSEDGAEVYTNTVYSGNDGHWMINLGAELPPGTYTLEVDATDERGAKSFPSDRETFKVKGKGVSLGGYELSFLELILVAALLVLFSFEFVPRIRNASFMQDVFGKKKKKKKKK